MKIFTKNIVNSVFLIIAFSLLIAAVPAFAQSKLVKKGFKVAAKSSAKVSKKSTTLYGTASFYAAKFNGRRTASGESFNHTKFTAACNALPLGTWIKITNLTNNKTVLVQTNDRLHATTSRLVDLTNAAAKKLGFVSSGLTRVKVEVLAKKP